MTRQTKRLTDTGTDESEERTFAGRVYGNPTQSLQQEIDRNTVDANTIRENSALPPEQESELIQDGQSGNIGTGDAIARGIKDADRTRPTDIDPKEPHNAAEYVSSPLKPHSNTNRR